MVVEAQHLWKRRVLGLLSSDDRQPRSAIFIFRQPSAFVAVKMIRWFFEVGHAPNAKLGRYSNGESWCRQDSDTVIHILQEITLYEPSYTHPKVKI